MSGIRTHVLSTIPVLLYRVRCLFHAMTSMFLQSGPQLRASESPRLLLGRISDGVQTRGISLWKWSPPLAYVASSAGDSDIAHAYVPLLWPVSISETGSISRIDFKIFAMCSVSCCKGRMKQMSHGLALWGWPHVRTHRTGAAGSPRQATGPWGDGFPTIWRPCLLTIVTVLRRCDTSSSWALGILSEPTLVHRFGY